MALLARMFLPSFIIAAMISPIFAASDILLKNNTRISGDIVSENENFISVNVDGSRVNVSKAMVRSINGQTYVPATSPQTASQTAAAPVPAGLFSIGASISITLKNGTIMKGTVASENDNFVMLTADEARVNVLKSMIASVDGRPFAIPVPPPASSMQPEKPPPPAVPTEQPQRSTNTPQPSSPAIASGEAMPAAPSIPSENAPAPSPEVKGPAPTPQPSPVAIAAQSLPSPAPSATPAAATREAVPVPASAPAITPAPSPEIPAVPPAAPKRPAMRVLSWSSQPENPAQPSSTPASAATPAVATAPAPPPAPASPVIPSAQPVPVPSPPPSSTQAQKPAPPALQAVEKPAAAPAPAAAAQTPARPERSAWDEIDGFGAVESENVKKLIEKLRSPFAFQRMRAALLLSRAGSDVTPAVPWLVRLLSDTAAFDPKLEKDSVITRYLQAPASINRIAAKTLVRIGKPAIRPLVNALDDENESVRLQAIEIISAIDPAAALKPLVQTFRDTSLAIREKTVEALAKTHDAQALLPYLKDKNPEVRKGVIDIVARIKDPKLVEPLIHLLADRDSYVREKAAAALGELRDTAAVRPLIAALSDDISFVRRNAAEALGAIGDTRALKDLSLAKKDESDYVAATAAAALSRLLDIEFVKHDRDLGSLVDALNHENPDIREKAANTLWVRTGRNLGVDYAAWKAWLQKQDSMQTPPVDTIKAPIGDTAAAKGRR